MSLTLAAQFTNVEQAARDLLAISDGLDRELTAGIHDDSAELLSLTSSNTPFGPGPQGPHDDLPHMRDMYSVSESDGAVSVISSHPGAIVLEYGGVIAPHKNEAGSGGAIQITEHAMAFRAGEQSLPSIEQLVLQRINRLIASH